MSFRELDIKRSYISYGDENIASSFLVPTLKHTKLYRHIAAASDSSHLVFLPLLLMALLPCHVTMEIFS